MGRILRWWDALELWWAYQNGYAIRCGRCGRLASGGFESSDQGIRWWTCVPCAERQD